MMRLMPLLRWRQLRWVACLAVAPALWACTSRKLEPPKGEPSAVIKNRFQQSVNRDLDMLFMIDDSSSMTPLQAKLRDQLPTFMNRLKNLPGGLPNLQVAVVSSSLGAGKWDGVPGCNRDTQGNVNGLFQHKAECTLNAGQTFIKSVAGANNARSENFTGDIAAVFQCIANLGDKGCGFEHQFESVRLALQRSLVEGDPNFGFLRQQAYLAVIMLTNEDDCSVPADSDLFNPSQTSVNDMYGGLQSYRCNEFGHKCDQPLPHNVTGLPMTLTNCQSKEDGTLVTVKGFTDFLLSLKPSPDQVLVAALAGPVSPYTVQAGKTMLPNGGSEMQPQMAHSCMQNGGEYADPGIRIKQWLDGFGTNGVLQSICADNFAASMNKIADVIGKLLGAQCVSGDIANNKDGTPDCEVTERKYDANNQPKDERVPFCTNNRETTPCWELKDGTAAQCMGSKTLTVCYNAACSADAKPTTMTDALVACALNKK